MKQIDWRDKVSIGFAVVGGLAITLIVLINPSTQLSISNVRSSSPGGVAQATSSKTNNSSSASSSSKSSSSNPFIRERYPKQSCGDGMPSDPSAFPVDFYPVYINFSESNLSRVKNRFCGDAFKIKRESTNRPGIMVGSFTSRQRAEDFRDFLAEEFGNSEIGDPKRWESKP